MSASSNPFPRSAPGARTVAIDVDNTIGDYTAALRPYAARFLNVAPASLADTTAFDYAEWGLNESAFARVHADAVADGMFAAMPVLPGARQALQDLSDAGYHLLIVTSRLLVRGQHRKAVSDTVEFLERNGLPFWDLCLLTDKARLSADLWIDDSPGQIQALRASGQQVVVFDQLYNRQYEGPRLTRWIDGPALVPAVLSGATSAAYAA